MVLIKSIRVILASFCFALFGICGYIIGAILFPLNSLLLPQKFAKKLNVFLNHFSWKIFVNIMCFLLLISVDTKDIQKFRNIKGTVIVANHPSLIDIVILLGYFSNSICIVKGKLAHNFFMKPIIKRIHIVNDDDAEIIIDKCKEAINSKFNFIIFPAGTREVPGNKQKFLRSSAQIALHSNANILPIKIKMSFPILGKHQKWYDLGSKTCKYTLTSNGIINTTNCNKSSFHKLASELTSQIENEIS